MKIILLSLLAFLLLPKISLAHCPLCTVGTGALAVLAASVGVSTAVAGIFIGAFSLALALWLSRLVKKKYISNQDTILTVAIFLGTVIPIMPLIREHRSVYVSLFGQYGTLMHNNYLINLFLVGVVVGAGLLFVSPFISRQVTQIRQGQTLPFQGMSIMIILLVLTALIFQFFI